MTRAMLDTPSQRRQPDAELDPLATQLLAAADHEVTFLAPVYTPGSVEFSADALDAVVRRGGRIRMVLQSNLLTTTEVTDHARWLGGYKVLPRVVDRVPVRVMIIDRATAVLFDHPAGSLMRSPAGVRALCRFADLLWETGVSMRDAAARQRPAPRTEIVLRLLAEGLTDEAVARRIGVSVRTVRNDVASTMTGLDAHSRFQAGVRATQLGLI